MAGELSTAGATLALNLLFRNTGDKPTKVYLGLATATMNDSTTLSTVTEEDDSNYQRQEITFGAPTDVSGKQTIKNSNTISFGPYAAAGSAVTYCFITDVASGISGTILAWMQLTNSKTPGVGDTLTFAENSLVFDME
jgi:hypothetical protein